VDLGGWSSAALKIGRSPPLCNPNEFGYRSDDPKFHELLRLDNFRPNLGEWNSVALMTGFSPSLCDLNEFDYRPKQPAASTLPSTGQRVHQLLHLDNFPPQSPCPLPYPVELG
jgi:hypothetical protein